MIIKSFILIVNNILIISNKNIWYPFANSKCRVCWKCIRNQIWKISL